MGLASRGLRRGAGRTVDVRVGAGVCGRFPTFPPLSDDGMTGALPATAGGRRPDEERRPVRDVCRQAFVAFSMNSWLIAVGCTPLTFFAVTTRKS